MAHYIVIGALIIALPIILIYLLTHRKAIKPLDFYIGLLVWIIGLALLIAFIGLTLQKTDLVKYSLLIGEIVLLIFFGLGIYNFTVNIRKKAYSSAFKKYIFIRLIGCLLLFLIGVIIVLILLL